MKKQISKIYRNITTSRVDGIGVIEIILILVIIIGLILIFRTQITEILQSAFNSITTNANSINEDIVFQ